MKGFLKKAAAVFLSAVMLMSFSACGEEKKVGNLEDVTQEPGDIFAVIKIMDYGEMTVKLLPDAAPESVKRFTTFAERGYYENRTIHRVIKDNLIQGGSMNGDGTDGNVPESQYVPIETDESARNFYGALCFASSKKGSYSQFYIVANHTPQDIDAVIDKLSSQLGDEAITARLLEKDLKYYQDYLDKLKAIPEAVKEKYKQVGGLYELDGSNTVFGQVIEGFDVLEAIADCEVVTGNTVDDNAGKPSKPIDQIIIESVTIVHIEPPETETETEETTSKKKKKETEEIINAETLPPLTTAEEVSAPSADDTTAAGDLASEAVTSAEPAALSTEGEIVLTAGTESSVQEEDVIIITEE